MHHIDLFPQILESRPSPYSVSLQPDNFQRYLAPVLAKITSVTYIFWTSMSYITLTLHYSPVLEYLHAAPDNEKHTFASGKWQKFL